MRSSIGIDSNKKITDPLSGDGRLEVKTEQSLQDSINEVSYKLNRIEQILLHAYGINPNTDLTLED